MHHSKNLLLQMEPEHIPTMEDILSLVLMLLIVVTLIFILVKLIPLVWIIIAELLALEVMLEVEVVTFMNPCTSMVIWLQPLTKFLV